MPALSAAARDILGSIVGTAWLAGIERALKPLALDLTSTLGEEVDPERALTEDLAETWEGCWSMSNGFSGTSSSPAA